MSRPIAKLLPRHTNSKLASVLILISILLVVMAIGTPTASAKTPRVPQNRVWENSAGMLQSRPIQTPQSLELQRENSIGRYDSAVGDTLTSKGIQTASRVFTGISGGAAAAPAAIGAARAVLTNPTVVGAVVRGTPIAAGLIAAASNQPDTSVEAPVVQEAKTAIAGIEQDAVTAVKTVTKDVEGAAGTVEHDIAPTESPTAAHSETSTPAENGTAGSAAKGQENPPAQVAKKTIPKQLHHFATNKNKVYAPALKAIAKKFGLDLDEAWKKESLPRLGRHPNGYHQFVLRGMEQAAKEANGLSLNLSSCLRSTLRSQREIILNYLENLDGSDTCQIIIN